jgi:hypothetical protein
VSHRTIPSDRLRAAVAAFGRAKHDLVECLQSELPGETLVVNRAAYDVVPGRGGSPRLLINRVVRFRKTSPHTGESR